MGLFRNNRGVVIGLCDELDKSRDLAVEIEKKLVAKTIECIRVEQELREAKTKLDVAEKGNKKLWQFVTLNQRLDQPVENGSIRALMNK